MPVASLEILRNGLVVDVEIGPSEPWRELLWRKGIEPPLAVRAEFLIDTGADTTMLSEQIARSLALEPISQTRMFTSTTGADGEPTNVYAVGLVLFPHLAQPLKISTLQVLARLLLNQGNEGLIGRDLLSRVVLVYDGPRKVAHLNY